MWQNQNGDNMEAIQHAKNISEKAKEVKEWYTWHTKMVGGNIRERRT
jgi:hypothetical protein